MILYESIYAKTEFFEDLNLLKQVFFPETVNMTKQEFQESQLILLDRIIKHKPQIILSNLTDLLFLVSVDLQDWLVKNIYNEGGKYGVRKVAYLVSPDFMVQLSAEMVIEDYKARIFENRFFANEAEAMNWLLK